MDNENQQHPWVEAAEFMTPNPIPTHVKMEEVELEIQGKPHRAALLTAICPNGVFSFFMPPGAVAQLLDQGFEILSEWNNNDEGKIVVADKNEMHQTINLFEAAKKMKGHQ